MSWFRIFRRLWRPKLRRIDYCFVNYTKGDQLVSEGWTIAPEEDYNKVLGRFLEGSWNGSS